MHLSAALAVGKLTPNDQGEAEREGGYAPADNDAMNDTPYLLRPEPPLRYASARLQGATETNPNESEWVFRAIP